MASSISIETTGDVGSCGVSSAVAFSILAQPSPSSTYIGIIPSSSSSDNSTNCAQDIGF